MPDVVINFATAGDANVARAFAVGINSIRETNKELAAAYNASGKLDTSWRQVTSAGAKGMRAVGGEIKQLTLGILGGGGLLGAINLWKSANDEVLQQAHETGLAYDAMFRKLNIQSGLRGLAGEQAKENVLDTAFRRSVPEEVASAAATQLVSSGFDAKEVLKGGANDEFLQGMNAMNQRGAGVDSKSLAEASTSFMTAMGVDKTAKGMRATMSSLFSAFQGTNIQLPDLQQYAAKAGGMKGKLSFQELIAAGSIHRDLGIQSAESASGLESLVSQAGTASASPEKIKALKKIGLKPGDIDLIGENFDTMLGRISTGLETIPEEQREPVLKQVFEQAGVKFIKPLLANRQTMTDRIGAMQNAEAGYADAVAESERGPNAVAVRQGIAKRRSIAQESKNDTLVRDELAQRARDRGESAARIKLAELGFNTMRALGISQEFAGDTAFGKDFSGQETAAANRSLTGKGLEQPAFIGKGEKHADLNGLIQALDRNTEATLRVTPASAGGMAPERPPAAPASYDLSN